MIELLKQMGALISKNMDQVADVIYLDEAMGAMCYVVLKDGRKLLLSLTDSGLKGLPLQ